jgi:hypothetical protein
MATMTRANFGTLLTPIHRQIIFDEYNMKPEEYTELFKVINMEKYTETFPELRGMGMWSTGNEANVFNEDSMEEGATATLTAVRYDNSYILTWELVRDDIQRALAGYGKGGSARGLAKGLKDTIETYCANIINNGFTVACYDGEYLFDTDHPYKSDGDDTNLATGAITDANLKLALTQMRDLHDGAGLKMNARADKVFVAANKEFDLYTVLQSAGQAGTLSNDKNVLPRLSPVVNDYLTDNYWGILDSTIECLTFGWRDKPLFDSEKIPATVDYRMYGYTRFDADAISYRGIVASVGS